MNTADKEDSKHNFLFSFSINNKKKGSNYKKLTKEKK